MVKEVRTGSKPEKLEEKPAKANKAESKKDSGAEAEDAKVASSTRAVPKSATRDTGSVDFQVKNFSSKIAVLSKHLKTHAHDFDSRRGLLIMVGKRRRLLNYVKKTDSAKYEKLAKSLKLKK